MKKLIIAFAALALMSCEKEYIGDPITECGVHIVRGENGRYQKVLELEEYNLLTPRIKNGRTIVRYNNYLWRVADTCVYFR